MDFGVRKLNRCSGWDYRSPGFYFVTICIADKKRIMADVVGGVMVINGLGLAVQRCWEELPRHYSNCELDEFAIMPDHFHGVVKLLEVDIRYPLWEIVRGFKTFSSRELNKVMLGRFRWHKSFHDRIIRDKLELDRIRRYVRDNPERLNR